MEKLGYSVRRISGHNALVYEHEYKIALRVSTTTHRDNFFGKPVYDYHFMVQTISGQWAEKQGSKGPSNLFPRGYTPDTSSWIVQSENGNIVYDSPVIYYAIGR